MVDITKLTQDDRFQSLSEPEKRRVLGVAFDDIYGSDERLAGLQPVELEKVKDVFAADVLSTPYSGSGISGIAGDVGRGLMSGVARGLGMVGAAAEWVAPEGSGAERVGRKWKEASEKTLEQFPELFSESAKSKQSRGDSPWNPRYWPYAGMESVGMMTPGILAGAATGGSALVAGGVIGTQFWGSTAQEKYDELSLAKPDMPEGEKVVAANLYGAAEGGLEAMQAAIPFKFAKFIPQALKDQTLKGLTKGGIFEVVKALVLKVQTPEVAMELTQEAIGGALDYKYELREDLPSLRELSYVVGPTLIASTVLGGSASVGGVRERQAIGDALKDPNTDPKVRAAAVQAVYEAAKQEDAELAEMWKKQATPLLKDGKPIIVQNDSFYRQGAPAVQSQAPPQVQGNTESVIEELENNLYDGQISPEQLRQLTPQLQQQFGIEPDLIEDVISGFEQSATQAPKPMIADAATQIYRDQAPMVAPAQEAATGPAALDAAYAEQEAKAFEEEARAYTKEANLKQRILEARARKAEADAAKAEKLAGLRERSTGRPSTAQEAAQVFEQELIPAQVEAELAAETREQAEASQRSTELFNDMATGQEEVARGAREKDVQKAFSDRDLHIPSEIRPAITKMENEVAAREAQGVKVAGTGNDAEVIGRYGAVSPEWFKAATLKEYDKKNGTRLALALNAKSMAATLKKVRADQELTGFQKQIWSYLQDVAADQMQNDPELVQAKDVDDMQAKGFEPVYTNMVAASLNQGDKIIGSVDGRFDEYTVKGEDNGDVVLQDGITARVDAFDMVEVAGIKKSGKEAPTPAPTERRKLDAQGNRIDRRQAPVTPGIEIKAERNKGLVRLWDRVAARDRVASQLDAESAKQYLEDLHDELLGDYGVTSFADVRRVAAELDKQGIPYVIERSDGGNMGAINKAHGNDHQAADVEIRQVWGEIYATRVREHGSILGRDQGDELLAIWPNYTVAEVEKIRAEIEKENRAKRDAMGYAETIHAKIGLPTGALHINYGLVQGEPGRLKELEKVADLLQDAQKKGELFAIAEEKGYVFNKETEKYEPRKLEQETRSAGERDATAADRVPGEVETSGSPSEGPSPVETHGEAGEVAIQQGDVAVGDTVYFTDIRDESKRIPGNFRGFHGNKVVVVYDGGKQMSLPAERVFKNDVANNTKGQSPAAIDKTPKDTSEELSIETFTEQEARARLQWQSMGQKDGTKTHRLNFNAGDGIMTYATVESYDGGKSWKALDRGGDAVGAANSLREAKAKAADAAIKSLREDGYIASRTTEDGEVAPAEVAAGARYSKRDSELERYRAALNRTEEENKKLIEDAKKFFGTTFRPEEAGYILPDGKMLDFSGKHQVGPEHRRYMTARQVDHRELQGESALAPGLELDIKNGMTWGMMEFMARTGAIRFDQKAGLANAFTPPTPAQLRIIGQALKGKDVTLELVDSQSGRVKDSAEINNATPQKINRFFAQAAEKEINQSSPLFSKSQTPATKAATPAQVRAEVVAKLGEKGTAKLEALGKLKIVRTADGLPAAIRKEDAAAVFYDGTVYLVADAITPGEAGNVMAHEGLHLLMAEDKTFQAKRAEILAQFDRLRQVSKPVQDAFARVPKDTPQRYRSEEAYGYFLESNPQHSLAKRMIAAVRMWLYRHGVSIKNFTEADFVALASQGLKSHVRSLATGKDSLTVGEFAQPLMSLKDAVKKITDNPAFRKWFGDSKVVDEKGEPLVVYHGSHLPGIEKFKPNENGAIFFSSDKGTAESFAHGNDALYPVYLSIKNPFIIDAEGKSFASIIPSWYITPAKRNGHDGVVVKNIKDDTGYKRLGDTYIAFDPTQIKSIFNRGTFDESDPRILYSAKEIKAAAKAIYSKLEQVAAEKFTGMKAQGVVNFLTKQGVKKAEMEAAGLPQWLAAQGLTAKVSKHDLQSFVQANTVTLEDVVLGDAGGFSKEDSAEFAVLDGKKARGETLSLAQQDRWADLSRALRIADAGRKTKFATYQLPGAEEGSYREMFVTAPRIPLQEKVSSLPDEYDVSVDRMTDPEKPFTIIPPGQRHGQPFAGRHATEEAAVQAAIEKINHAAEEASTWQDGHSQYSDVKNPVVRIRFNSRTDSQGRKILMIEEMQGPSKTNQEKMPAYLRENIYNLGVKRTLAYAKEHGFDGISWTPGAMQAERYDLSKHVDSILVWEAADEGSYHYEAKKDGKVVSSEKARDGISIEKLSAEIGKDLADKAAKDLAAGKRAEYSGDDLSVGGGGLKQLYDTDLPRMFAAYGKGEVGETTLKLDNAPEGVVQQYAQQDPNHPFVKKNRAVAPFLPLTEQTPASYPLFSRKPPVFEAASTGPDLFTTDDPQTAKLMKKLQSLFTKTGELSPAKVEKALAKYEDLTAELKSAREDVYAKQKALEKHIVANLAPADRFRVMPHIKRIAKGSTTAAREKYLHQAMAKVVEAHDRADRVKNIAKIDKLLTPPKRTPRGVPGHGNKDAETNRLLTFARIGRKLSQAQVLEHVAPVLERLDREQRELTTEERERLVMLQALAGLDTKSNQEVARVAALVQAITARGREGFNELEGNRKERLNALRDTAFDEFTGGKGLPDDYAEIADARKAKAGAWQGIKDALRSFDDMHQSFEFLLDKFSRFDKSTGTLQGKTTEYFSRQAFEATIAEHTGNAAMQNVIHDKLQEFYGKKGLAARLERNSRIVEHSGVYREKNGREIEKPLSQNMAYKLWQMFQQPSIAEEMARHGYTAETLQQVEAFLDPAVKRWAEWQLKEFYPTYREGINEVFRKLFYVDMANIEGYTPISRQYENQTQDEALLGEGGHYSSLLGSATKARIKNARDFNILDGDQVLMRHIVQMEHFKAWGVPVQEMRSVLGAEKIQTAIKHYHGSTANTVLKGFVNQFASGGIDRANTLGLLDRIRSNFTKSVIGANPVVFLKQLASIPAYTMDIPTASFVAGVGSFMANPSKAYKTLMQSEALRARYDVGFERDIMLAMQRSTVKHMTKATTISDFLMLTTRLGDKAAIMLGGWSVYQHHYKLLRKKGIGHDAAHTEALEQFDRATKRSQQAGDIMDLAHLQRVGSLGKLFTMFMTSPASYYRNTAAGLRNLAAGRGSKTANFKRFFVSWMVLPMVFQWIASGFEWDDEKMGRAALVGPLNGLFMVRDALEGIMTALLEGHTFGTIGVAPPLSVGQKAATAGVMINKAMADGFDSEELLAIAGDFAEIAGHLTGVPVGTLRRTTEGIQAALEGETEHPIRRALGYGEKTLAN